MDIPNLIPKLWKRNGREDLKLAGLLIANTEGDPWSKFLGLLRKREPVEVLLEVAEEIKIEDFGRRAVILAKQTLNQKINDLEKEVIITKYEELVGEIINGEIYQILSREVLLVDSEGNELSLPRSEQIPKDRYRKGENIRGIVLSVEMIRGNPRITISSPGDFKNVSR